MSETEQKIIERKRHEYWNGRRKRGAIEGILLAAVAVVFAGYWKGETELAAQNIATIPEITALNAATEVKKEEVLKAAEAKRENDLKAAEAEKAEDLKAAEAKREEELKAAEESEGSFYVAYQGMEDDRPIELRHCKCVYDADDIEIYARYLYWLMVPETFPCNQYVLYIRTPQEELQLYPVRDFLVDDQQGILYTKIAGDDGFESVRSMSFRDKSGHMQDTGKEIFNAKEAEEMLCGAYLENRERETGEKQDGAAALFSNITVELTESSGEGAGILRGEVGGFEKATGRRYYADWEIDMAGEVRTAELCVLKQYDPIRDKEELAACNSVFDQIEQGDWSNVKPIEQQYVWGAEAEEWIRMDVNGDGMPELIDSWTIDDLPDYEDSRKRAIFAIYAYQDGMAEMIYLDDCDGMEFLFITDGGELVYEWGVSGWPCTNVFRRCQFDLKWNKEYLDTLVRYRFEEYDESDVEYYREHFPDTYGVGGSGIYYLRERPKTEEELKQNKDGKYVVREYLTEEQFLKMYEDWTGWDFYKAQLVY